MYKEEKSVLDKMEPPGRVGVVLQNGPLNAYIAMDLGHFCDHHGAVNTITTRDLKIYKDVFPWKLMANRGIEYEEWTLRMLSADYGDDLDAGDPGQGVEWRGVQDIQMMLTIRT